MFWINFVAVNSAEQLRSVFLHWDGLHIHQRSLKEDCPRACIKRERSHLGNTSQNRSVFNINLFLPCHHAPPFGVAYTTSQEVQKVQRLFSCLPTMILLSPVRRETSVKTSIGRFWKAANSINTQPMKSNRPPKISRLF